MTIKEQIIKEIDQLSENELERILINIRQIKAESLPTEIEKTDEDPFFQAYLETMPQWEDVCRRLANS
jgi:uncharacterized membrane-anchored protein YitT (DUF2179 family)